MDKVNNFIDNLKQVDLTKIDFSLLCDIKYLTDPNPTEVFIYEQWIYVFVLINLIISLLGFTLIAKSFSEAKPKYRFIRRISFMWLTNSIILLFYNLVRAEGVRFLSMRLFLVIIALMYVVIIVYILYYCLRVMPKRMKSFSEARTRNKYSK